MTQYFEQLPEAYQKAINEAIKDGQGDEDPQIARAFREWEAESLLELEISNDDDLTENEFGGELIGFRGGWEAREQQKVDGGR